MSRYPVREPNRGEIVALHQVPRLANGKRDRGREPWWEGPDGRPGIDRLGIKVRDLPLYGAAAAHRWDLDQPVIVCEGEGATLALVRAGWQACGTFGAAACPNREPLMILAGHRVLLWPDADDAGRKHMLEVGQTLGEPGEIAASIRWITWPAAGIGGDAFDAVATGADVTTLVAAAGDVPLPESKPAEVIEFGMIEARRKVRSSPRRWMPAESPIERFNAAVPVSEVLRRDYGLEARPGRAVRCPFHDDRHPSLSVLPDDRRAYCHAPTCRLSGRGADAWALAHMAIGAVAR
jgi:hypothetical protein